MRKFYTVMLTGLFCLDLLLTVSAFNPALLLVTIFPQMALAIVWALLLPKNLGLAVEKFSGGWLAWSRITLTQNLVTVVASVTFFASRAQSGSAVMTALALFSMLLGLRLLGGALLCTIVSLLGLAKASDGRVKARFTVALLTGVVSLAAWWFGYFHSAQPGAAEENLFMASPWYYFLLVSAFGTLSMICFLCQLFARPESGEARD